MARCLVVQHVAVETPYAIGEALERHGVAVELRRTFADEVLPGDLDGHDGLVVLGGPMAAHLDRGFPTRRAELDLLSQALDRQVPTLGVCLGAQLLALAAGGGVFPGRAGVELGWGAVTISAQGAGDPLLGELPPVLEVFHWHGDTFDLGPASILLASSAQYPNQAFRAGSAAWGLQFHVEVDEAAVGAMVAAFPDEVARVEGGAPAVLARSASAAGALLPHRDRLLGRFAHLVAATDSP